MSDKIGLFTGSFDPMTNGHLDIIERASKLFDKLYVGVFYNPHKQGFLPVENRKRAVEKAVAHLDNVEVLASHDQLVVDVARRLGAKTLVRGFGKNTPFTMLYYHMFMVDSMVGFRLILRSLGCRHCLF